MLLKRRPPGISSEAATPRSGFEHLDADAIVVLRWLNANKIDFVLVGSVARSVRGETDTSGPVAIVPAPYGRNWERLCTALVSERAGLRAETAHRGAGPRPAAAPVKLTPEKLARGRRWLLRCGDYDLDIESLAGGAPESVPAEAEAAGEHPRHPGYQELLYETARYELADGVSVEVAAPEDLEHFSHVRRTGTAPEFRITRKTEAEHRTA